MQSDILYPDQVTYTYIRNNIVGRDSAMGVVVNEQYLSSIVSSSISVTKR